MIDDEIDVNIMPKQKYWDNRNINIRSSYFNDGNQFYLQSNVTIPKNGYIETQFGGYSANDACSLTMTWISMMIIMLAII